MLTGFWHGAAWNFLLWGVYFGLVLLIEKFFLAKWLNKLPKAVSHLYALFMIVVGWTIFAFDDMTMLGQFLKNMFFAGGLPLYNQHTLYALANYGLMLLILFVASTPFVWNLYDRFREKKWMSAVVCVLVVCGLVLSTAYLVDASYNPFLYFRF